jgi:hypothetical protein
MQFEKFRFYPEVLCFQIIIPISFIKNDLSVANYNATEPFTHLFFTQSLMPESRRARRVAENPPAAGAFIRTLIECVQSLYEKIEIVSK